MHVWVISLQTTGLDWRFNWWGRNRELCARTGERNSYGYHVQSSKITWLSVWHKKLVFVQSEEWCETTGQKECASAGNKGTEKRRKVSSGRKGRYNFGSLFGQSLEIAFYTQYSLCPQNVTLINEVTSIDDGAKDLLWGTEQEKNRECTRSPCCWSLVLQGDQLAQKRSESIRFFFPPILT